MTRLTGVLRTITAGGFTVIMAVTAIITNLLDLKKGRLFHINNRLWARGVLRICGLRLHVRGLDRLDFSRNYVYVSNHASLLDIPAVIAGIPDQIRIVYKKELEKIPVFGWGLKWGSYIGIDRGNRAEAMKSIEEAAEKIRHGASVLLFAEGTRTLDGKLQPFKRGAFNLAVKSGVPVVPLTINGSFTILPKRSISVNPGTVELVLDSPLPVDPEGGKEEERRVMDRVHDAIAMYYREQTPPSRPPAPGPVRT
jgi:1-acyl-sn-glycerol-3-phosphate acyltransferase